MARELCSRCLQTLDESELAAVGGELLCPRCQAAAETREARTRDGRTEEPAAAPASAGPSRPTPETDREATGLARRVWRDSMEWCRGRHWWARLPLLALFAFILAWHIQDPKHFGLFGPINFAIHEIGHIVFKAFGRVLEILGGSLFQCMAPFMAMIVFWRQRDYFGILFCFGWLATNFFYVATYVADARAMQLELRSPGDGPTIHDWNWLLSRWGQLHNDALIALWLRRAATVSMFLFLLPGSCLVWRMWRTRDQRPAETHVPEN